jgi:hypothetical protein
VGLREYARPPVGDAVLCDGVGVGVLGQLLCNEPRSAWRQCRALGPPMGNECLGNVAAQNGAESVQNIPRVARGILTGSLTWFLLQS